jgi:hypothetical protein
MVEHSLDIWTIPAGAFPRHAASGVQLQFLLHYAVLAPSIYNTQPWHFRLEADAAELYLDARRTLPVVDPQQREAVISCGAALTDLRVALRHFGYAGEVTILPDPARPDLLARVRPGPRHAATEQDELLFRGIPMRHTNRHSFTDQVVPPELVAHWQGLALRAGAWLQPVQGARAGSVLGHLIARAERRQWADPAYRRERAHWEHTPISPHPDGIPGAALGRGAVFSYLGPLVTPLLNLGAAEGDHDRALAAAGPLVLVLGTASDDRADWLTAGQALGQVLLHAAVAGIAASFLNAPLQVADLRPLVGQLVGRVDYAQQVLRLGYGPPVAVTPRRDVCTLLD